MSLAELIRTVKIITVFNQKGGAGKTMLAMQLAGTLALRGFRVLVIDADEQNSATRWAGQASEEAPFPATVINLAAMGERISQAVKQHVAHYDFIIIDCPPALKSPIPSNAMLVSDLALIPFIPAPTDMWSSVAAKELAKTAQSLNESLKIRVVPNQVEKQTTVANIITSALEKDQEVPLTQTWLGSRTAFRECQLYGASVQVLGKTSTAAQEIESLANEVLDLLDMKVTSIEEVA